MKKTVMHPSANDFNLKREKWMRGCSASDSMIESATRLKMAKQMHVTMKGDLTPAVFHSALTLFKMRKREEMNLLMY